MPDTQRLLSNGNCCCLLFTERKVYCSHWPNKNIQAVAMQNKNKKKTISCLRIRKMWERAAYRQKPFPMCNLLCSLNPFNDI